MSRAKSKTNNQFTNFIEVLNSFLETVSQSNASSDAEASLSTGEMLDAASALLNQIQSSAFNKDLAIDVREILEMHETDNVYYLCACWFIAISIIEQDKCNKNLKDKIDLFPADQSRQRLSVFECFYDIVNHKQFEDQAFVTLQANAQLSQFHSLVILAAALPVISSMCVIQESLKSFDKLLINAIVQRLQANTKQFARYIQNLWLFILSNSDEPVASQSLELLCSIHLELKENKPSQIVLESLESVFDYHLQCDRPIVVERTCKALLQSNSLQKQLIQKIIPKYFEKCISAKTRLNILEITMNSISSDQLSKFHILTIASRDESVFVRNKCLQFIKSMSTETSIIPLLHHFATNDCDNEIRMQSLTLLQTFDPDTLTDAIPDAKSWLTLLRTVLQCLAIDDIYESSVTVIIRCLHVIWSEDVPSPSDIVAESDTVGSNPTTTTGATTSISKAATTTTNVSTNTNWREVMLRLIVNDQTPAKVVLTLTKALKEGL